MFLQHFSFLDFLSIDMVCSPRVIETLEANISFNFKAFVNSIHIAAWGIGHLFKLHTNMALKTPRTTLEKPTSLEVQYLGQIYFCLGTEMA